MPLYIYDNVSLMHMCAKLHQSYLTLCNPTDCSPPGSSVQDSSGKSTGVGCSVLFKGVFLTRGSNPCLLSPALAGGFFTTSALWEALHPVLPIPKICPQGQDKMHMNQKFYRGATC